MATPANRVPVRIARGSKANLDTAIAAGDLKEGEICYATDENGIYVVEGGVLTQAGADLASTSIDALSDVDTTTAAPTDGQVLTWVDANGRWEPTDAAADAVTSVNTQTGAVVLDADDIDDTSTTHKFATAAQLTAADNALQPTDSIDALSDVDTTTAAPTDGQALVWVDANSQWEPGTVSGGGGAVDSVNGQTGVVSLGIQDMDDFELYSPPPTVSIAYDNNIGTSGAAPGGPGNFSPYDLDASTILLMVDHEDSSGTDVLTDLAAWTALTTHYINIDGVSTQVTLASFVARADRYDLNITKAGSLWTDLSTASAITLNDGPVSYAPLADDDILQWVDADQKFKPIDVRAALGIGEYADDAAAGTGGVASGAMYYNTTSSDYRLKT
jgi:hypothetical protein